MASWESRSWPARRWLADRLIGSHGYSKNVAPAPMDWTALGARQGVNYGTALTDQSIRIKPFDQETA